MKHQIMNLLETLANLPEQPDDLRSFIEAAPKTGHLPPNISWTLIALFEYRARQQWAWEIIRPHITEDTALEARQTRRVYEDWECEFGNVKCVVRNRVTGEPIRIDVKHGPELILCRAFVEWIQSRSTVITQRLIELHPNGEGVFLALDELVKNGILHAIDEDEGEFELCETLHPYATAIEDFATSWRSLASRLWLAVLIGDWPRALQVAELTGQGEIAKTLRPRVTMYNEHWIGFLQGLAHFEGLNAGSFLWALADANSPELRSYIQIAWAEEADLWDALEIIKDDPTWCPTVYDFYQRSDSLLSRDCAYYLARHNYRTREIIEGLVSGEPTFWGSKHNYTTAIELALTHAPDLVHHCLRRAIRSSDKKTAAAVMALLDTEWTRKELLSVLAGSDDHSETRECRAALRESRDHRLWKVADEWESAHAVSENLAQKNAAAERDLREEMSALFDRVMTVREDLILN